jgi:hypothetical protein
MQAFLGDQAVKDKYVARIREEAKAGRLKQHRSLDWWNHPSSCTIGGAYMHWHTSYPQLLGIPEALSYVQDEIFLGLPKGAKEWPEQFLSAIKPGADLSQVFPQFAAWLLDDPAEGVIRFTGTGCWHRFLGPRIRRAIQAAAQSMRGWPGELKEREAATLELKHALKLTRSAVASGIAPAAKYAAGTASNSMDALLNNPHKAASTVFCAAHSIASAAAAPFSDYDPENRTAARLAMRAEDASLAVTYARQSEKLLELLQKAV